MTGLSAFAILVIALVVLAVVLGGSRSKGEPAAAPAVSRWLFHGNSALHGGWIDGAVVRQYFPTPVQQLAEHLRSAVWFDETANGLTLREAMAGGPVALGQPVLGQTQATCRAIFDLWDEIHPTHAYVALLEVDVLFDPQYVKAATCERLQRLVDGARARGITLVLQSGIRFAPVGPLDAAAIERLDALNAATQALASANGVQFVDLRAVPFDPATDLSPDLLHPTAPMHARYTHERASQLGLLPAYTPPADPA